MDPSKPRNPRPHQPPEARQDDATEGLHAPHLAAALARAQALLDAGGLSAALRARILAAMEQAERLGDELDALTTPQAQKRLLASSPTSDAEHPLPIQIAEPLRALAELGDLEAFIQVAEENLSSHPEHGDALKALLRLANTFRINDITTSLRRGVERERAT